MQHYPKKMKKKPFVWCYYVIGMYVGKICLTIKISVTHALCPHQELRTLRTRGENSGFVFQACVDTDLENYAIYISHGKVHILVC